MKLLRDLDLTDKMKEFLLSFRVTRAILSFFGMNDQQSPDGLSWSVMKVPQLPATLIENYKAQKALPPWKPRVSHQHREMIVDCYTAYKDRTSLQHEFLVFKIVNISNNNRETYLRIERAGKEHQEEEATSSNSSVPLSKQLATTVAASNSKEYDADDTVTMVTSFPTANNDLTKLFSVKKNSIEGTAMTLLDVAIAAKTVHDASEKYKLTSRQCYYFVESLCGILQEEFKHYDLIERSKKPDMVPSTIYGAHVRNHSDDDVRKKHINMLWKSFQEMKMSLLDEASCLSNFR